MSTAIAMMFLVAALVATLGVVCLFAVNPKPPRGSKWPPGPRGIPWFGPIWKLPRTHIYLRLGEWSKKYGDLYAISLFGTNHIFLGSDNVAHELLSKRGVLHQDRPAVLQLEDSRNAPEYLPLLGHNEIWFRQRKLVTQIMNESVRNSHFDIPALERPQMLLELLYQPEDFQHIIENYTSRIISQIAYGDSKHYARVRQGSQGLLEAISPANQLSNLVPQLRYLPSYLSPWKQNEAARHAHERAFFLDAFAEVAKEMRQGTAPWSFMKRCLEMQPESGISDLECAYIAGMLGLAGVLTTSSPMMTYLLAMTLYPEWQQRVQAEVDKICGDRMPIMSDAPQMPVLRAVIMEIMRWRPIVPAAIPHRTTEDCFYEDYFIPKGSHIHATTWAITRNPTLYPSPDVFDPDRWLQPSSPSYKAPLTEFPSIKNFTSFGYGRRICMGQDLTEHEFFLAIGGMAWAMSVEKKRDALGKEIDVPLHNYGALVITKPEIFPFSVIPRSEKRTAILEEAGLSQGC